MLLSCFIRDLEQKLQNLYPEREAREITLRLCEDFLGVSRFFHILSPRYEIPSDKLPTLLEFASRLQKFEPLQYVLGAGDFYGRRFKLSPSVLIPRPETEQLVELSLAAVPPAGKVIDLCTGSGCIAWTVKLEKPGVSVWAVDISREALDVARTQFEEPSPIFVQADIMNPLPVKESFDVLISNPPYVLEGQKREMLPNVLGYEPPLALFVPDSDPLVFYRAIAGRCRELLRPGGEAFLEVNEDFAGELAAFYASEGFVQCRKIQDFAGKDRFVHFKKRQ